MKKFSRVSDEWKAAVFGDEPQLEIRALIVADGDLSFNRDRPGFSLTRFRDVLSNTASAWETIKVITAHRSPDLNTRADLPNFKFDQPGDGLHITRYDQVWLFGYLGEEPTLGLTQAELEAITEFMNQGGGVFATGDHEDLGCAMCGNIPRVRRMRRWHFKRGLTRGELPAPGRNESTRIDTLREGTEPGFEPADQEDAVPQEIRPKFFINENRTASEPHELLATRGFAITVLPDHMHEGECVSAAEIMCRAKEDEEVAKDFPLRPETGEPVWPETVAIASSAGGAFFPVVGILPVDPRSYIVISAYDGHLVEHTDAKERVSKLGRVVVDASFHHFADVNLDGFIENDVPKREFEIFTQYYRNILNYLLPPDKQRLYFLHMLRALRFSPQLLEELQNLSPNDWGHVVYTGTLVKRVISENFSSAHARRCALTMLSALKPEARDIRVYLEDLIDLWRPRRREPEDSLFFLNSEAILISVIGQAMLGSALSLPASEMSLAINQADNKGLQTFAAENLHQGVRQLQERVGRLGKQLETIFEDFMN